MRTINSTYGTIGDGFPQYRPALAPRNCTFLMQVPQNSRIILDFLYIWPFTGQTQASVHDGPVHVFYVSDALDNCIRRQQSQQPRAC